MGFGYDTRAERLAAQARYAAQLKNEEQQHHAALLLIANKIVMMVSNKIIHDIVRPGPSAEERECYVMAQEIHDINPELVNLVTDILKVEKVAIEE